MNYQMGVDAHVSCGASEALVLSVRNVLVGVDVDVEFGQPEVDDVDHLVASQRRSANQKVFRLDVAVDEMLGVDELHQVERLYGDEQDGFE